METDRTKFTKKCSYNERLDWGLEKCCLVVLKSMERSRYRHIGTSIRNSVIWRA